jgi:Fe-S-cluster containining protein
MDLAPCHGCDHCGLRCEAGVKMSREEFEGVQSYVAAASSGSEIERVTLQDKRVDLGDGVSVTMCRYRDLERGRCMVYAARPLICRLLGHVEWMPCPIEKVKKVASTPDALNLMRAYALEDRRTFEEWEKAGDL